MGIGGWEIIALAVLALMIFGPERLPGIAQNVGKTIGRLRTEASTTLDELKRAADVNDLRDVAGDLRATTSDLRQAASLSGPIASPARPTAANGHGSTASARGTTPSVTEGLAPFDPDAT